MKYWTTEMTRDLELSLTGDDIYVGVESNPIRHRASEVFSTENQERINLIAHEEKVCDDALWYMYSNCQVRRHPVQKDWGIVFQNVFYHFKTVDGNQQIRYYEEWLDDDWAEIVQDNEMLREIADIRGLDEYDEMWMKDRTRQVHDLTLEDDMLLITLEHAPTDLDIELYDTLYLHPWVLLNGFAVLDFVPEDIYRAQVRVKWTELLDSPSEADEIMALLKNTVQSVSIYKQNKQKNIDPREGQYDGPEYIQDYS